MAAVTPAQPRRAPAALQLTDLAFEGSFVRDLPADPVLDNLSRQVPNASYTRVDPTPVAAPKLLGWSHALGEYLGIEKPASAAALEALAGNQVLPGMQPYAARYGGHQFGHWAGQLGDGRAISLGELPGRDGGRLELQLKGAGPTPYSRRADGRAVLRSSIREFLCSEAMHHLGVPTTRALSLVATGEGVMRDMFYDGHPAVEPGAVVCRVAPSFLRFGNFELPASRGDPPLLESLTRYTLRHFYPELEGTLESQVRSLYLEVARRTARLIAHWQAVGFVHGVMNTDNMSILGLTIDYGPYGWVDNFDPSWTPNTTDAEHGRYRFGNQPGIGLWNVERLGVALLPLVADDRSLLEAGAEAYGRAYESAVEKRFAAKLGLPSLSREEDEALVNRLFVWLASHELDMTRFFRGLCQLARAETEPSELPPIVEESFYSEPPPSHREAGLRWLQAWWHRTRPRGADIAGLSKAMEAVNPKYVLRNYLAQEAIDAAHGGDDSKIHALLEVMRHPFDEQPGNERYAAKRPDWARSKPGCSALSCSS